jgi:hypothetical protein
MKNFVYTLLSALVLASCIGDDIIDDFVQPTIRIGSLPQSLAVGERYAISASLFGNTGMMVTDAALFYSSSDENLATIDQNGVLQALNKGTVSILVTGTYQGELFSAEEDLLIDAETIEEPKSKRGRVATTSSYPLSGDFLMESTERGVRISFDEDYMADTRLPGLYVYLTNNKNTNVGALELGRVEVFSGEHFYEVDGVGLDDFSHILYYCKPFNVKVGDGAIID